MDKAGRETQPKQRGDDLTKITLSGGIGRIKNMQNQTSLCQFPLFEKGGGREPFSK